MTPVTFIVPGAPIPKARARVLRSGRAYTPKRTAAYENAVGTFATLAMRGRQPLSGPCRAVMRFDMPIPASWSSRKRALAITGEIMPTGRPDIDNLAKSVLDAVRGVIIGDDAAIIAIAAVKRYSTEPKTICTLQTAAGA